MARTTRLEMVLLDQGSLGPADNWDMVEMKEFIPLIHCLPLVVNMENSF
jgi:hypothetical protein